MQTDLLRLQFDSATQASQYCESETICPPARLPTNEDQQAYNEDTVLKLLSRWKINTCWRQMLIYLCILLLRPFSCLGSLYLSVCNVMLVHHCLFQEPCLSLVFFQSHCDIDMGKVFRFPIYEPVFFNVFIKYNLFFIFLINNNLRMCLAQCIFLLINPQHSKNVSSTMHFSSS